MRLTKEELNEINHINNEIKMWQKELEGLQCRSLVKGQEITDMPFGRGISDKVAELATDIADTKSVINGLLSKIQIQRKRTIEYINTISDSTTRQIIYYKCVSNLNWFQVAKSIGNGYSADGVKQTYYRFLKKNEIN